MKNDLIFKAMILIQFLVIADMYFDKKISQSQHQELPFQRAIVAPQLAYKATSHKANRFIQSTLESPEWAGIPPEEVTVKPVIAANDMPNELSTDNVSRAADLAPLPPQKHSQVIFYNAKQDETPVSISFKLFGNYRYWKKIMTANPGIDFDQLAESTLVKIPLDETNL